MWDTNLLLYTMPIFIESLKFSKKLRNVVSTNTIDMKTKNDSKVMFLKILETLKNLEEFVSNKLISFILINQDYSHPSESRQ